MKIDPIEEPRGASRATPAVLPIPIARPEDRVGSDVTGARASTRPGRRLAPLRGGPGGGAGRAAAGGAGPHTPGRARGPRPRTDCGA